MARQESFDEWMRKVDDECYSAVGVSIHDLPDAPFRSMYDDGTDPKDAVSEALEEAGLDDLAE